MTPSRRLLLLGLVLIGTQVTGCYCNRPYLFPRLQLCGQGPCAGPAFPRLAGAFPVLSGAVHGGPVVGPVYDAPVYGGPGYDPVTAYGGAGCTNCGATAGGIPLAPPGYHGAPIVTTPGATPPAGAGGSVPMNMPGGTSSTGIPFDSALVSPTVNPPASKKLDPAPDSKKIMTAGK